MPAGTCGGQNRASDPLEVELKVVVSCLVGDLGTKLVPPGKDTSALNHRPITPAPRSESLQVRDFLEENKSPVSRWACSLNDSGFLAFLLAILETPAVILAWGFLLFSKESHCAFPTAFIQEGHSLELNVPLKAHVLKVWWPARGASTRW